MGVKLPESMRPKKVQMSEAKTKEVSGSSLLGKASATTKKKEEKQEYVDNNKDSNRGVIARGVKELLPSIGKGVTSAIDDFFDAADSFIYAYDQKQAEKSGRYSMMEKAAKSKALYQKAASKHVLGDKIEKWEDEVDKRRAAILEDNPTSKAAETTVKALGLGESVGRMLPSVGLSIVTGGVGGAVVGQAAGLGSMALSVYDHSFDESMAKGYDTVQAGKKALGDAMLETGTELLFGGIAGLGKGVVNASTTRRFTEMVGRVGASEAADTAVRKFGVKGAVLGLAKATARASEIAEQKTFRGLMYRSFGEGAEEMIAEAIGPFIERATVNPHASDATFSELVEAGIGGALISFAMAPLGRVETQIDKAKQRRAEKLMQEEEARRAGARVEYKRTDIEYQYTMLNNIAFDQSMSQEDTDIMLGKMGLGGQENLPEDFPFKLRLRTNKRLASEYIRKAREAGSTPEAMAELWTQFRGLVEDEIQIDMDTKAAEIYEKEVLDKRLSEDKKLEKASKALDTAAKRRAEAQEKIDAQNVAGLDELEAETDEAAMKLARRNARASLTRAKTAEKKAQDKYDTLYAQAIKEIDEQVKEEQLIEEFGQEMVDNFSAHKRMHERRQGRLILFGRTYTKAEYERATKGAPQRTFEEMLAEQKAQIKKELEDFAGKANDGLKARGLDKELRVEVAERIDGGKTASYHNGTISISADRVFSAEAAQYYMAHEMLHAMSAKAVGINERNRIFEGIVGAAKSIGFNYDEWYNKLAPIYEGNYSGLTAEQRRQKVREETCARFMQTAFGSQSILESLALANPELLAEMEAQMKESSVQYFDKSLWDYERLKILDAMTNAIARPRDAASNAEKIAEASDVSKADAFTELPLVLEPEKLRQYNELKERYGSFDKYGLPKKINSNVATSQFANRVFKQKATNGELKVQMQENLLEGAYTHLIMTDKAAISKANEFIRDRGTMSAAYTSVRGILKHGKGQLNKNDIVLGEQMLIEVRDRINEVNEMNKYAEEENKRDTTELYTMFEGLLADLCVAGTRAGQNLQAFSLMKKMTPQGRLYYIESQVTALLEELYDKRGRGPLIDKSGASMIGGYRFQKDSKGNYLKDHKGNMIEIKVSEELRERLMNCTTIEEMDKVETDIISDIASQIPPTVIDRVTAWRYLAMLGNPRTHIRNIVSNVVMGSTIKVKNRVGGALEDIFLSDKTSGRTKTLNSKLTHEQRAAITEFADRDWDLDGVSDVAMSGGKVGFQSRIRQEMATLGFGEFTLLDKLAKFNTNALEAEDNWSGKRAYKEAFRQYCSANGLTAEFLSSGTVEANTRLAQARSYGVREAAKATYHDANVLATHLNQLENSGALGKLIIGGLIPFKKTPANILKRGIEYSPIGLVNGLLQTVQTINTPLEEFQGEYSALNSKDAKDIKKAEARYSAEEAKTKAIADAIDKLASGLTGTGIMLLGLLAGRLGLMKAGGSDNDREEYYDQMLGNQEYSVTIGGVNYTLDWLTPISMPLFAGVEVANFVKDGMPNGEEGELDLSFESIVGALSKIADPVTNLSVLQGINDALSSYEGGLTRFVTSAGESYAGQFIPTFAGQLARSMDPIRRSSYAPKTGQSNVGKKVNTFINRMENKIPGLSERNAAYVDMWGRNEENAGGSFIGRLFANSVVPWYTKEQNKTEADDYITALFDVTGKRTVIPTSIEKNYSFGGEKIYLGSDEYQQTQEIVGQLSHIGVTSLMSVKGYGDLTPDEQATLVGKVYEFARAVAKADYASAYGYSYDEERKNVRMKEAIRAGLSIGEALYIDYVANGFRADKDSKGNSIPGTKKRKVINFYRYMGLNKKQIDAINIYDDTILR